VYDPGSGGSLVSGFGAADWDGSITSGLRLQRRAPKMTDATMLHEGLVKVPRASILGTGMDSGGVGLAEVRGWMRSRTS
jgi:hypothetical protein